MLLRLPNIDQNRRCPFNQLLAQSFHADFVFFIHGKSVLQLVPAKAAGAAAYERVAKRSRYARRRERWQGPIGGHFKAQLAKAHIQPIKDQQRSQLGRTAAGEQLDGLDRHN